MARILFNHRATSERPQETLPSEFRAGFIQTKRSYGLLVIADSERVSLVSLALANSR